MSINAQLLPLKAFLKSGWHNLKTRSRRQQMRLADPDNVCVSYGHEHVPTLNEYAQGGMVKFQWMQTAYPNSPNHFNMMYMVSSQPPEGANHLGRTAKKIGAHLIWNHNGVAYPGWYGERWKVRNAAMAKLLHMSDYVFYQSKFCRLAADEFLGPYTGQAEILYNPVDTSVFTPAQVLPEGLILLLAGNQYQYYRVESALKTLALVREKHPEARLVVTGKLNWLPDPRETARIAQEIARELNIEDAVTFQGSYSQAEAPEIFRNAHILLHTRYIDPCPTVVIEALSCGLPVVHSLSGGTPELVGSEAGIGIPAKLHWDRDIAPEPEALTEAVLKIASNHEIYTKAARARAVEKFDINPWIKRHKTIFESLL